MPFAIWKTLRRKTPKNELRTFRYRYQAHPFDQWNFFEVRASHRDAADELAKTEFGKIIAAGGTVMRTFYPAPS